jgi:UDP-N-acetylmuramate dehydrogenase
VLTQNISNLFLTNIPLAPFTSIRVGGEAKYFFEPADDVGLSQALLWGRNTGTKTFIMGQGTNLIVGDHGFQGLVIRLGNKFSGIEWKDTKAKVKPGELLQNLIMQSVERGFAGMEYLSGIPGSVGGAVCMNAGAFGQTTSDTVVSVISLSGAEKIMRARENLQFDYRQSVFSHSDEVIIQAEFNFTAGDAGYLPKEAERTFIKRQEKQPYDEPSAGSIFKRPKGNFAGTLIEKSGLKGKQIGGAKVSEKHAGFIVNTGKASAKDIRTLISVIVDEVEKKQGVRLETEVVFIGDF